VETTWFGGGPVERSTQRRELLPWSTTTSSGVPAKFLVSASPTGALNITLVPVPSPRPGTALVPARSVTTPPGDTDRSMWFPVSAMKKAVVPTTHARGERKAALVPWPLTAPGSP